MTPDFYFYDLNGRLTFLPTDRDVLTLSLYNGQDHLDRSRDEAQNLDIGGAGATLFSALDDVTDWGNAGASAQWSRQWNARLHTRAMASLSRYFSDYDRVRATQRVAGTDSITFTARNGTSERNRVEDLTLQLNNALQATSAHLLQGGVQASLPTVSFDFVRNDTLTVLDREQQAAQVATYLQDTWRPAPMVSLDLGVRATYFDGTGRTYVEPRGSASLGLGSGMTLKASAGRFRQFVARVVNDNVTEGARDFWLLADDNDVAVSGATQYVLGASWEIASWLIDVEGFQKDLDGLTEYSLRFQRSGRSLDDLFFTGTGKARGLEVLVQRTAGPATGWISYTLAKIEHTFPDLNDEHPFPALHDQRHELKVVGTYSVMPRLNLSGTWTFGSGTPYTAPVSAYALTLLDGSQNSYVEVGPKNDERLPPYHRMDVAATYHLPLGRWSADLTLSVFNLYNRQNVWYREFDLTQAPTTVTDINLLGFTPNLSVQVGL